MKPLEISMNSQFLHLPPIFKPQRCKESLNMEGFRVWAVLDLFQTASFLIFDQMRVFSDQNLSLKIPER
jgi:hypothetical protein